MAARTRKRPVRKIGRKMKTKLFALFMLIVVAMLGLIGRLMFIEYTSGDAYTKKVLSLQSYDSKTIPFQRGNIVDSNGTVLATSVAVYNVVLDCSVMTSKKEYITPTIDALTQCFPDLDRATLEDYANNSKDNKYIVLLKKLSYDAIQPFVQLQDATDEKGNLKNPNIKGVWFETEYQRNYPFKTLASSVIGFTSAGNVGTTGLENYYNDTLNGVNGREYGYLNADNDFQKTVIIAVIIENPKNGEILAMANYPNFDLNNPRDMSAYYSEEQLAAFKKDSTQEMDALNKLWQNFCVTHTYEPGSVQKPFTVACGLDTGTLTTDMTFLCDGYEMFGSEKVSCVNRSGHGIETLEKALMDSCNDALMQMSYKIGAENFLYYQSVFGFGQKTGVDLPGEANTSTLMYTLDNIKPVDLATNVFGQNYNCTMIEMVSAFSSLVNGGNYYQPHVVKKIADDNGNTVKTIEPTLLKKTVSENTSATLKNYLQNVVANGTGKVAKVDGYSMGGKTGTAQMYDETTHLRKRGSYLVSFIGCVPAQDPQLVIYTVIDQPNVQDQPHSNYAQNLTREILKEVLPYMNIYPDEEQTGINADLTITGTNPPTGEKVTQEGEQGE